MMDFIISLLTKGQLFIGIVAFLGLLVQKSLFQIAFQADLKHLSE